MNDVLMLKMLNNDCFLAIFRYISLLDLANLKQAYESLGAVTDIEFTRKTRRSLGFGGFEDKIDEALQIIKQFGASVEALNFNDVSWNSTNWGEICAAINEHCNETLQALALCGNGIESLDVANIQSIGDVLKNVKTLNLTNRCDNINNFILSHCVNVTSITLVSNMDIFSHEKMFSYEKMFHETVFLRNVNVLKLKLQLRGPLTDDKMKMIVDNLMHSKLEELSLRFSWSWSDDKHLHHILRLGCLKRLSIGCLNTDIASFLRSVDALHLLNTLSLSHVRLTERCIAALGQINRLKVLQLRCDCNQADTTTNSHFDAVQVLCGNKNFEHLLLFCCKEVINQNKFLQLIEKRKESGAERCLHLTLRHEIYNASVKAIPPKVLQANNGTLKLIDEWNRNYEYYNLDEA